MIESITGLLVQISDSRKFLDDMGKVEANKKIQVIVDIDGEKKEFTLHEFMTLLGFIERR